MAATPPTNQASNGGDSGSSQELTELEVRQQFTQGLLSLLAPTVHRIDDKVTQVRLSQIELRAQIDSVAELLCAISDEKAAPVDLEPYVKKLNSAKRRVMLVNNIIQNAQERLGRLHASIQREQARLHSELKGDAASAAAAAASTAAAPSPPPPASS